MVPFQSKMAYKWLGAGVGPPGGASPYETLLSTPLPFGSNLGMAKSLFGEP